MQIDTASSKNRTFRWSLILLLSAVSIVGVFRLADAFFTARALERAAGPLSLYRETVVAELERFSHLTFVLARDPFVVATAQGADTGPLNQRLAEFAVRSGLEAIYLMNEAGLTIASSNADRPESFLGQNYSFRPYFQTAIKGDQGEFYGIGSTTGLPGYFFADQVKTQDNAALGVIAIKLGLTELEETWRAAGETVFLANKDGVILLSSRPDWRYLTLGALTNAQKETIERTRQFASQALDALQWKPKTRNRSEFGGDTFLHLTTADLPNGWELHYLANTDQVTARTALATGSFIFLASLLVIMTQQRRTARIGAALKRSVAEEAQLRQANERLAVEIEERKAAERRLKRTQDELERAGRLSALGQLAASVTHELGQPIVAMRNHLVAAEIANDARSSLTVRLSGLVDRMESITRQLKFFARNDDTSIDEVDLRNVVQASIDLVAPNILETQTDLAYEMPPKAVAVKGSQFRLEQVITNLLRNALDAMSQSETRNLQISLQVNHDLAVCKVADSGRGLEGLALEKLQEPFFTTRGSGEGMGLGLAISARIVEEHGGDMTAEASELGGAEFCVRIPIIEVRAKDHDE